jgi:hypothetical protein
MEGCVPEDCNQNLCSGVEINVYEVSNLCKDLSGFWASNHKHVWLKVCCISTSLYENIFDCEWILITSGVCIRGMLVAGSTNTWSNDTFMMKFCVIHVPWKLWYSLDLAALLCQNFIAEHICSVLTLGSPSVYWFHCWVRLCRQRLFLCIG